MPRIARQIEDNGYYHVLTRGNDGKRIFRRSRDFSHFLNLIAETQKKYRIAIYHYCLMDNHIHFLAKALNSKNMPKYFQILFQRYACYFRKRYDHKGYLFQNRYKSYTIDKESYLLECARYIERNPVRANVVMSPEQYRWSSFLYYAEGRQDDAIKKSNPLYIELADSDIKRQEIYKQYVLQERPYEHIVDKGLGIE